MVRFSPFFFQSYENLVSRYRLVQLSESVIFSCFTNAITRNSTSIYCRGFVSGICLLLFDELESLCREKKRSQFFRRGFPFMLGRFLDMAEEYPGLIIVATTNNIGALHSHIRCAGKMEVEVLGKLSI